VNLFGSWWSADATDDLTSEQREQICAWVAAHGVDPDNVRAVKIRGLRVHVYEYKLNERGNRYEDPDRPNQAAERHYTVPLRSRPPKLVSPWPSA
jgi:hypothetical protein